MAVCNVCAGALRSQKRAPSFLELEFQEVASCGVKELPGCLEEQYVLLLTAETSLQPSIAELLSNMYKAWV